jgi:hypothetical protein
MNRLIRWSLATPFILVLSWLSVNPGPPAGESRAPNPPTAEASGLIDLLPESTVVAVEIRDVARRWSEIRGVPAIRGIQDRLLAESGLRPDDLPRLAGERAVLALVTAKDGRSLIPVAILRPSRLDEAEAILRHAGINGLALTTRRAGNAMWIGPAGAPARLDELAAQGGAGGGHGLMMEEVARRLPEGGLVRGWLAPDALRTLLLDRVEGIDSPSLDILRTFIAAELHAARYIGFRRDLTADGLITDAVIGFDSGVLPAEVARVLATPADSPPILPSPLPPGVLLAGAFRTEAAATWDWLHHVAALDSRGPMRNFEFWVDEFQDRYDRDLERDLVGALGQHGWFFLLEGETVETLPALLVIETRDAGRVEEALVDLGSWLVEQTRVRTLGLLAPRMHDGRLDGFTAHGLSFWTPFAELPGPAFLVTGEHLVVGSGTPALRAGLELLRNQATWEPVAVAVERGAPAPNESIRVRGSTLSRWFDALVARGAPRWSGAIAGLESLSGDVWHQEDVIRIHGEVHLE